MPGFIGNAIGLLQRVWRSSALLDTSVPDIFDLADLRQSRENARFIGLCKMQNPEEFPDLDIGYIPSYRLQNGVYIPQLKPPVVVGVLNPDSASVFLRDIQRGLDDLPVGVRQLFAERATVFKIARRLSDIDPVRTTPKFDSFNGLSGEYTTAYYEDRENFMALAQEYRSQTTHEYEDINRRTAHALLHESGHAIDDTMNVTGVYDIRINEATGTEPRSAYGLAFSQAYMEDVLNLKNDTLYESGMFAYYLPEEHGGVQSTAMIARSELFAELFAEHVDGGDGPLHSVFPQSADVLRRILLSLDHEFRQYPDIGHIPASALNPASVSEKRIQPSCQT